MIQCLQSKSCTEQPVPRPFHDRMPVILDQRDYARWLDPANADPGVLQEMLRPYPSELMTTVVSTFPECLGAGNAEAFFYNEKPQDHRPCLLWPIPREALSGRNHGRNPWEVQNAG
jgi:hypothetical protein